MCARPCSLACRGISSPCFHGAFPLYVYVYTCVCVQIFSCYKDSSHNGSGPTLMTPFKLNYLFIDCISKWLYFVMLGD